MLIQCLMTIPETIMTLATFMLTELLRIYTIQYDFFSNDTKDSNIKLELRYLKFEKSFKKSLNSDVFMYNFIKIRLKHCLWHKFKAEVDSKENGSFT